MRALPVVSWVAFAMLSDEMGLLAKDVRGIVIGAAIALLAIYLTGTARPEIGGPLLILGWATLAWSIHRFGRRAPETD